MKPADAAAEYWATLPEVEAVKPVLSRHEKACKVLKEHMAEKKLETYQGIRMTETPQRRFDLKVALAKFGERLNDCFDDNAVRRSLIPVKKPARLSKPAA